MTDEVQLPRDVVLDRLRTDLIGPREPDEALSSRPSDVWLTGILWPQNTELAPEEDERLAVGGGGDDRTESDDETRPAAVSMRRPSTAGLSFAAAAPAGGVPAVNITVSFGLYDLDEEGAEEPVWRRRAIEHTVGPVELAAGPSDRSLDGLLDGLRLNVRAAPFDAGQLVTVTLVNGSRPSERGRRGLEKVTLFQVGMVITPADGTELIARPSRRAAVDEDDQSAELLYRDAREYATGHTCSADWTADGDGASGRIRSIRISWIPDAVTPAVSADGHEVFSEIASGEQSPLSAGWLSSADDAALKAGLTWFCDAYERWISGQETRASGLDPRQASTAARHLAEARRVLERMRSGVAYLLGDRSALTAFRLANLAMETQRDWSGGGSLRWRPFQLGFLLLSLQSAADGGHPDRSVMDLLWFPTGGGKTEAYLGLIAFVALHRRLSRPEPDKGAGVTAIMRYTLRLLTTQQFVRAAAMIMACEAIRRGRIPGAEGTPLGNVPFSIGLWVGGDATPNRREAAYESETNDQLASPRQLLDCPCCHQRLDYVQRRRKDPVTVECQNGECLLSGANLPVWTVDDDIYERRPTLVIGTVDKFAQIVRKKETAALFGVGTGAQPQLVLQDELHLISGPLGTLAGLYETALDLILSADGTRPKIIGSTATIRRATEQVNALFDRATCQFPPPGLDASDSGFAVAAPDEPGRLYAGVTTAGRSAKFTLQAVLASLLQTAAVGLSPEERDPYWTLLAYFNSLRELGGALVLTQDDVNDTLRQIAASRDEEARRPGSVEELTSRRTQQEIRDMLDRLLTTSDGPGALDVVLATNMVSVGVDIPRLGLMVVNGQPKTMAEYIQATSRVGRGRVAGLVVSVLNAAKPRDRSHYETFRAWHSTLYRDVEATSVTPFASRARDRALHAVLVAAVRHLTPGMLDRPKVDDTVLAGMRTLIERIAERACRIDPLETDIRTELTNRLDRWLRRAPEHYWQDRKPDGSLLQSAEQAAAKRAAGRTVGQAWPTPNTMRSVEPATPFRVAERLKGQQ